MTAMDYESVIHQIAFIRGLTINEVIRLERAMDEYIATKFCGETEQRKDLMELILCTERMTFYSKKDVLQVLLKKHNPEFLKKHKSLAEDLGNIASKRNILAHQLLDLSATGIHDIIVNKKFTLIKINQKRDKYYFDDKSVTEFNQMVLNYTIAIRSLFVWNTQK